MNPPSLLCVMLVESATSDSAIVMDVDEFCIALDNVGATVGVVDTHTPFDPISAPEE